jgi:LEM3 (ligand-effect modulator 3) family / CDC50 family
VSFKLDRDVKGPVLVYYELENYYQNHRRYVNSYSTAQLLGGVRLFSSLIIEALNNSSSQTVFVAVRLCLEHSPANLRELITMKIY